VLENKDSTPNNYKMNLIEEIGGEIIK